MPLLARHSANKNITALRDTFVSSLTMVFCLTIPAAAGLYLLAEPIIRLIFERGAFSPADTLATAQALSLYAIGLFAYSSNKVIVPVFYALEKTRYPVIASFFSIAVNVTFIFLTIEYFQHRAIALSVSFTMLLNFLFLTTILYHQLNGFSLHKLSSSVLKVLAATGIMSAFIVVARQHVTDSLNGSTWQLGFVLFGLIIASVCLYGGAAYLLRVDEFLHIVGKVRSRFFSETS